MLRSLVRNVGISAGALLVISVVGLLLVPVLIRQYGIAGLGCIMIARLFLPSGGIGLFDFGVSDIAAQSVAIGQVDGNWKRVLRRLGLLALVTLALAFALAMPLLIFAPQLTITVGVYEPQSVDFVEILRWIAALLPILFLSLICEGCLKGFANFRALRLAEVSSAIVYACAALFFVLEGAGFKWIVYSYLASLIMRAVMMTLSLRHSTPSVLSLSFHFLPEDIAYLRERATLFFTSRFLGTVQHQLPTVLIALMVGPVGVGLYDTLARLPRFAKSVLGVVNTTLLPYATRMDAAGDDARMKLLLKFGLTLLPAIIFPPLVAVAAVSPGLLGVWVGPQFAANGSWLALFWALPALNTVVSFQNHVMMMRNSYLKANNRLAIAQIIVQLVISLTLLGSLSQFAFVAGYIGSMVALFVWQLSLTRKEVQLPAHHLQRLLIYAVVLTGVVVMTHFVDGIARPSDWISLGCVAIAAWSALAALTYAFFLGTNERAMLAAIIKMIFQRKKVDISTLKN
jgi:O-antigen/teichoic acid export membrane protein